MTRWLVSADGGLWGDFLAPRPASLGNAIGYAPSEATDLEVYEATAWSNERRHLKPLPPATGYTISARTTLDARAMLTLSFDGDSAELRVGGLLSSMIEAALNSLPAMASAGGCDVRETINDPGAKAWRVTFRETGAQAPIELTAEAGQVASVVDTIPGDATTAAQQDLRLEQLVEGVIDTATSDIETTLTIPQSGVFIIHPDERATAGTVEISIGGRNGSLAYDFTGRDLSDLLLCLTQGATTWMVTGDQRSGFSAIVVGGGVPSMTLTSRLSGFTGRAGSIDLSPLISAADLAQAPIILSITKATANGARRIFSGATHPIKP